MNPILRFIFGFQHFLTLKNVNFFVAHVCLSKQLCLLIPWRKMHYDRYNSLPHPKESTTNAKCSRQIDWIIVCSTMLPWRAPGLSSSWGILRRYIFVEYLFWPMENPKLANWVGWLGKSWPRANHTLLVINFPTFQIDFFCVKYFSDCDVVLTTWVI